LRPQDLGIEHLFERVRDAVVVADAHTGRIVLWNQAAAEIFGYSVPEALEMNVEELVPERLRERHRAGLARYRETGHGPYIDSHELLELPAVRKTGEGIRIEMSLSPIAPIRDAGEGDRRYALAVVRDITERKRTEEALRESEARFHALVQNALDIVMVTDARGTIRYVSPSVERVLGYRSEEMVGTITTGYVHPDDLERALAELFAAASKPGVHPVAVETRVRHKDGSWRHLEGIANNLLDDPDVEGMVFNHRDVTERKRAEEEVRLLNEELEERVQERTARLEAALGELKASEERYRLLVESAEDYAIFMVGPNGRVLDWNAGAERIFGYRGAEIVGEPASILFTPEDVRSGAPERELREAEEEGRAVEERWHVRKDGSEFWASGFVRPVRDDAGNLRGFAKVARDVTERRRVEEALREIREAERSRIARDLHDGVLQDLSYTAAAMGIIMLEAEGTGMGERLKGAIDAVRRAAEGLRAAVNDLRVEEEQDRPFPELVEALVERNRGMAQGYEVGLKVGEGLSAISLGGTGTEILRVIQEALTNARRHSGARSVKVGLSLEDGELVAEVADNGRGFGPRIAPGVGLSSMRERAAALGGKLEIESQVGQGTRVRLRVPLPQEG
jgi:PAS domain S-box-containing protein